MVIYEPEYKQNIAEGIIHYAIHWVSENNTLFDSQVEINEMIYDMHNFKSIRHSFI